MPFNSFFTSVFNEHLDQGACFMSSETIPAGLREQLSPLSKKVEEIRRGHFGKREAKGEQKAQ